MDLSLIPCRDENAPNSGHVRTVRNRMHSYQVSNKRPKPGPELIEGLDPGPDH